jgi:hypothetical protein
LSRSYRPIAAEELAEYVADTLTARPVPGAALRVALDGPACAEPTAVAETLRTPLLVRGRPLTVVRAESFWRDASLRLEYGREDVESFAQWLDEGATRRELLEPLGPGGSGAYLPSLRDPVSNRSTRERARAARPGEVVVLAGELLLGRGLPFDVTLHLALSPGARERRTDPERQWTLEAWRDYDERVRPAESADIAIRYDDPSRPARSG